MSCQTSDGHHFLCGPGRPSLLRPGFRRHGDGDGLPRCRRVDRRWSPAQVGCRRSGAFVHFLVVVELAQMRLLRCSLLQDCWPAVRTANDQRRLGRSPGDRAPVARRTFFSLRITHAVLGALHEPRRPTVARFVVCRAKSFGASVGAPSAPCVACIRQVTFTGFIDTFTRGVRCPRVLCTVSAGTNRFTDARSPRSAQPMSVDVLDQSQRHQTSEHR